MVVFDRWLRRQPFSHRALSLAQAILAKRNGPSWNHTFRLLRRCGLTPKTIFDVGVARGTPRLYTAFPQAVFHLIDPTRESLPFMQDIAKRYDARVHNVALGAKEEETSYNCKGRNWYILVFLGRCRSNLCKTL